MKRPFNQRPHKNNNIPNQPDGRKPRRFNLMWIYLIIGFSLLSILFTKPQLSGQKEIKWSEFKTYALNSVFNSVTLDKNSEIAVAEVKPSMASRVFTKQELRQLDNRSFVFRNSSRERSYTVSTRVASAASFEEFIAKTPIKEVGYITKTNVWGSFLGPFSLSYLF